MDMAMDLAWGDGTTSNSTSSSLTSRGKALAKEREPPDDDPDELELSRSLKMNSSCVESHSAVNVHAEPVEDPGAEGQTIGELGRLRWIPRRRATLLRSFLTLPGPEGCAPETAWTM